MNCTAPKIADKKFNQTCVADLKKFRFCFYNRTCTFMNVQSKKNQYTCTEVISRVIRIQLQNFIDIFGNYTLT